MTNIYLTSTATSSQYTQNVEDTGSHEQPFHKVLETRKGRLNNDFLHDDLKQNKSTSFNGFLGNTARDGSVILSASHAYSFDEIGIFIRRENLSTQSIIQHKNQNTATHYDFSGSGFDTTLTLNRSEKIISTERSIDQLILIDSKLNNPTTATTASNAKKSMVLSTGKPSQLASEPAIKNTELQNNFAKQNSPRKVADIFSQANTDTFTLEGEVDLRGNVNRNTRPTRVHVITAVTSYKSQVQVAIYAVEKGLRVYARISNLSNNGQPELRKVIERTLAQYGILGADIIVETHSNSNYEKRTIQNV